MAAIADRNCLYKRISTATPPAPLIVRSPGMLTLFPASNVLKLAASHDTTAVMQIPFDPGQRNSIKLSQTRDNRKDILLANGHSSEVASRPNLRKSICQDAIWQQHHHSLLCIFTRYRRGADSLLFTIEKRCDPVQLDTDGPRPHRSDCDPAGSVSPALPACIFLGIDRGCLLCSINSIARRYRP